MAEITHRLEDGHMVQVVSPQALREILEADGDTYDPPADFGPEDEWQVEGADDDATA